MILSALSAWKRISPPQKKLSPRLQLSHSLFHLPPKDHDCSKESLSQSLMQKGSPSVQSLKKSTIKQNKVRQARLSSTIHPSNAKMHQKSRNRKWIEEGRRHQDQLKPFPPPQCFSKYPYELLLSCPGLTLASTLLCPTRPTFSLSASAAYISSLLYCGCTLLTGPPNCGNLLSSF